MNCNPEIHNEMITMEYIDCLFCDQHLQQPSIKNDSCCDKPASMINDNGANTCKSCGTVNGYQIGSWRNQFMRENITWKILSIISMINTDYISAKSW